MSLDDWRRAVDELPSAAQRAIEKYGDQIAEIFLMEPATQFVPVPIPLPEPG